VFLALCLTVVTDDICRWVLTLEFHKINIETVINIIVDEEVGQ
jgi:hypothetical protein